MADLVFCIAWESIAVIVCNRQMLAERCVERGYTIEEVMPCVVYQDGDEWTVDVDHPAYPRTSRLVDSPPLPPASGPGTELSRLLKRFGISPTPTCSCRAKAAEMDRWGCDEAAKPERIDEVVAVMRAEAAARGLPFLDLPARLLVKRAIANARKAEATRAREADRPPIHPEQ
jgi:hypothetical protein